ncbi:MAG TPA: helix-turn-helix domain-containing protein [Terriglobales bacterium]|nr:helix-turn-helix domain-containing protein [Terriglobales bacterium]
MKTYKTIPFEDVMSALPAKRRAAIEAKGRALLETIYRRATLAEMRKSRRISQAKLANVLGVKQMQVSRLERREDPRLSTLRRSVEALGGQLTLIATFPDQEPMVLVAGSAAKSRVMRKT